MNRILKLLYTIWCAIVFSSLFLFFFPAFFFIIQFPSLHHTCYHINRIWAYSALFLVGIKPDLIGFEKLEKDKQYVFCANHFSLLDIVSFGFTPLSVVYVGKSSLAKIPLFGYMFRKLHVTVDRTNKRDRYRAFQKSIEKMGNKRSLVMYPEGGIISKNFPQMVRFKEGAFRIAIEQQIPLVPVTLPDNWIILPDEKFPLISRKQMRMIVHDPIPTAGLTSKDIPQLKDQVFDIIQTKLNDSNKVKAYEYR